MMIVWWLIIIGAIVLFVKLMPSGWAYNNRQVPDESALEILRRRYANGEISREEYEERREVLRHR